MCIGSILELHSGSAERQVIDVPEIKPVVTQSSVVGTCRRQAALCCFI
jgi:hypothetical protein